MLRRLTFFLFALGITCVVSAIKIQPLYAATMNGCDPVFGEDCHIRDGVYILKIQVNNPQYEFDMVMANESTSGDERWQRELVRQMVARSPHSERVPILAMNADYFGTYGPEGLTVKNGVRFPNSGRGDNREAKRSSLSISRDHQVRLGVQTDCANRVPSGCVDWVPDPDRYQTTLGGGPLFIADGQPLQRYRDDVRPCDAEEMNHHFCQGAFAWSALGINADATTLIVAAAPASRALDMWQMTHILLAEGAWRAMKLDGGGSTQLWYRGSELVPSADNRPVANALVIYARAENCPLFCDVWRDNVFLQDIQFQVDAGLVQGFGDGTFRPDSAISRAEVASLLWRWLRRPAVQPGCTPSFPDLPPASSPHHDAIAYLTCEGIIQGFGDGTFRPDAEITRGESISLILRVLLRLRPGEDSLEDEQWAAIRAELGRFSDALGTGVHDDNIARARWIGLVHGYSDGLFWTDRPVSRGQFAKILTRAIYFDLYQTEIFVPCSINYEALLQVWQTPDTRSQTALTVDATDNCRIPAALEAAPGELTVYPEIMNFAVGADGEVSPVLQGLSITHHADQPVVWVLADTVNLLSVVQSDRDNSALVSVEADQWQAGTYTTDLMIQASDATTASVGELSATIPVTITVALRLTGDVNCDSTIGAVDALFVLQYAAGLREGTTSCPRAAEQLWVGNCDLNGDQTCDVVDGLYLLQCDAGISNVACP